jgi:hypothetical protein
MKRSVKIGIAVAVLCSFLAVAKTSQAQSWGFYVNSPRASFGATSYGYGGYGGGYGSYGYSGAYGLQAYQGHVGYNARPAFRCVPQVYCAPPCYPPPVHYHHHHGHHGHGRW